MGASTCYSFCFSCVTEGLGWAMLTAGQFFSSVSFTSLVLLMASADSGYLRREMGGGDTDFKKRRLFVCFLPSPICGKFLDSARLCKGCEYAVYCVCVFLSCIFLSGCLFLLTGSRLSESPLEGASRRL